MNQKTKKQRNKETGFTLPELLVAMGLFLIVVTIATGAFVQSLRTQRAAVELIAVNDNANIILEQMAREVRTGTGFSSPNAAELRFTNYLGEAVVYRHGNALGAVERSVDGISFEPLTASNVDVKRLLFRTSGAGGADKLQPRITISIGVSGRSPALRDIVTDMQTTISPRLIDS
jgi:prepilin-type N-terminal cleavage/methylation domain-containing protein